LRANIAATNLYVGLASLGWRKPYLLAYIVATLPQVFCMPETKTKSAVTIRDLRTFEDLEQVAGVEREVWGLSDLDTTPLTLSIATREAGSIWVGAFDGDRLIGFAFGFLGTEHGQLIVHSHMLAVREPYRNSHLGYSLKLAQRERVLALRIDDGRDNELRIHEMTWTFDPLQSRNAHLNFAKLGVVSESYKTDFYGPETSSILHRNGTDRLWVTWPLTSRRVRERLQGKDGRAEILDALSILTPLVQFNGDGKPVSTDLDDALNRQRIAIEIPSNIGQVEQKDPTLAREWRRQTRWAFTEALKAGFLVVDFCRTVRGQQGPGVYLLEKARVDDYVPETMRRPGNPR
jgi:predicted GNAT superfamily acetyltransferase